MKANEAESSSTGNSVNGQNHVPKFAKVQDGRKQDIRGLWIRGERYYAQLKIENPTTGIKKTKRVPLLDQDRKPVTSVAQAVAQMARLKTQRSDNTLPVLDQNKRFADYVTDYVSYVKSGPGAKKMSTAEKEESILNRWIESIGQLRLDQIKRVHVNRFIEKRMKGKAAPRTINLDVIAFRQVMKRAFEDGLIQRLPTEGLRPLKGTTQKRSLFSTADLDKLCAAAFETKKDKKGREVPLTENAQEFVDYIKLMAYCGARRNEALGFQWDDCDFKNGQLHVKRQITTRGIEDLKNRQQRVVDFNPRLEAHLLDMQKRSKNTSKWLFPSPQRGDKDIPAQTFRESLSMVRERAKMPTFGNHDCRHHFISMGVMSGIDFMTIAAWVGHQDGGVLIGKVYGHLANEHRKLMAEKMNFGPAILSTAINQ